MIDRKYAEYAWEQTEQILAIDSPVGYTMDVAAWSKKAFEDLGFKAHYSNKGGVVADLGGEDTEDALLLTVHSDTLGGMVSTIKPNGRLQLSALGGLEPNNTETENVRVRTRDGRVYEGTFQLANASFHVNEEFEKTERDWDTMEVVLDEDVRSAADVRALGIEVGDIVCFEPRTRRTASGYIKSRFLDDKLSMGIVLGFAKYIADNQIRLPRKTYVAVTIYEEVGHGCSSVDLNGVTEILSVDMGCVGDGLQCTEKQVSICAKDKGGPYNYNMVTKLINAAKKMEADYAVDVYPRYSSDATAALRGGADVRHGLIGAGVYASHGYERSHMDGVYNTIKVICGYLGV